MARCSRPTRARRSTPATRWSPCGSAWRNRSAAATKKADRAIQIIDWAYANGHDKQYGGIYIYTSLGGGEPPSNDLNRWGLEWDYKIWWVHSEAVYSLALAAIQSDSPERFKQFKDLSDYTLRVFPDPKYGEWYEVLSRDGKPVYEDKAKWIKSAFHIPRNLMKLALLFERK